MTEAGHQVQVHKDGGIGSGFSDADYRATGATIVPTKIEPPQKTRWSKI